MAMPQECIGCPGSCSAHAWQAETLRPFFLAPPSSACWNWIVAIIKPPFEESELKLGVLVD